MGANGKGEQMGRWTECRAGTMHSAIQELLVAFGNQGEEILTSIKLRAGLTQDIADFAERRLEELSRIEQMVNSNSNHQEARKIMGSGRFFGITEAMQYFGVTPTEADMAALANIPWCPEVLERFRRKFALVAVFPVSIAEIIRIVDKRWPKKRLFNSFDSRCILSAPDAHDFAHVKPNVASWQLVNTSPPFQRGVPGREMRESLLEYEMVPTAQILVYSLTTWSLAPDALFLNSLSWCADSVKDEDGKVLPRMGVIVGGGDGTGQIKVRLASFDTSFGEKEVGLRPIFKRPS